MPSSSTHWKRRQSLKKQARRKAKNLARRARQSERIANMDLQGFMKYVREIMIRHSRAHAIARLLNAPSHVASDKNFIREMNKFIDPMQTLHYPPLPNFLED